MPAIQRITAGLRSLFNYQAGGQNPSELSELVRGTVDVFPHIAIDLLRGQVEPFSLAAGQADFIEVPAEEMWLWNTWHVQADVGVGESAYFEIQLERVTGLGLNPVSLFGDQVSENAAAGVAYGMSFGQMLPRLMLLTPGMRIVVRNTFGTGTVTGDLSVTFYRLEV